MSVFTALVGSISGAFARMRGFSPQTPKITTNDNVASPVAKTQPPVASSRSKINPQELKDKITTSVEAIIEVLEKADAPRINGEAIIIKTSAGALALAEPSRQKDWKLVQTCAAVIISHAMTMREGQGDIREHKEAISQNVITINGRIH